MSIFDTFIFKLKVQFSSVLEVKKKNNKLHKSAKKVVHLPTKNLRTAKAKMIKCLICLKIGKKIPSFSQKHKS